MQHACFMMNEYACRNLLLSSVHDLASATMFDSFLRAVYWLERVGHVCCASSLALRLPIAVCLLRLSRRHVVGGAARLAPSGILALDPLRHPLQVCLRKGIGLPSRGQRCCLRQESKGRCTCDGAGVAGGRPSVRHGGCGSRHPAYH